MTSMPPAAAQPHGVLERLLRVDHESKPAVYLQIFDGADINNLNYWRELLLSAAIAVPARAFCNGADRIPGAPVSQVQNAIGFGAPDIDLPLICTEAKEYVSEF